MVRDIGESIGRYLDESRRALPTGELILQIRQLTAMAETELSDIDKLCVLEELRDCRAELDRRLLTTAGTA